MSTRWLAVSMKPPPRTPVAERTAETTSLKARSRAFSSRGSTCTCSCRSSPPKSVARATPGTASNRGRIVHCTRSRSCIGDSRSLTKPSFSRSMVEDVSGSSLGGFTPSGSLDVTCPNASATICRARYGSTFSWNTTVTTESPEMVSERTACTPLAPLIACSIGSVTRSSTCSATSPGASVCTAACGGTNSGNTSYLARASTSTPYTTSIAASAHTTSGKRRDQRMIAAIKSVPAAASRGFHAEQRGGAGGDDALARRETARDEPPVGEGLEPRHLAAHEGGRRGLHVHPHLRVLAQQCAARQDYSWSCAGGGQLRAEHLPDRERGLRPAELGQHAARLQARIRDRQHAQHLRLHHRGCGAAPQADDDARRGQRGFRGQLDTL